MNNRDDVKELEKLYDQIKGMIKEFTELSKKKPNDAINSFKLTLVNSLLERSNNFLQGEFKPFNGFETFDQDSLPTNSDVILILTQFQNCLQRYAFSNMHTKGINSYWILKGKISNEEADSYHFQ